MTRRTIFDKDGGTHRVTSDQLTVISSSVEAPSELHIPFGRHPAPVMHHCIHAGAMACNLLKGRFATIALSMPGSDDDGPIGVYVGLGASQLRDYATTFLHMADVLDGGAGKQ